MRDAKINTFTCNCCGTVFEKGRSDMAAFEEFKALNPTLDLSEPDALALVCEDCDLEFRLWAEANGVMRDGQFVALSQIEIDANPHLDPFTEINRALYQLAVSCDVATPDSFELSKMRDDAAKRFEQAVERGDAGMASLSPDEQERAQAQHQRLAEAFRDDAIWYADVIARAHAAEAETATRH